MTNIISTKVIVATIALTMLAATPFAFAQAAKPDTDCLRAGQETLRSLGAFTAAARGEVDYSAFADIDEGPIRLGLEEGSFLKLSDVFKLHLTNPELFAWCDVEAV